MSGLAIIGRPNTGKTSLFNLLIDSYEYVGNWSGVTVERIAVSEWTVFSVIYPFVIAYILSFLIYQFDLLFM